LTKKEIGQLIALAVSNFPHMQDKDLSMTARLWEEMFSDMPFALAKTALMKVLALAKFWPTVAEIREAATELITTPAPTALEAWGMVREAIRKDKPESSLHPAIQRAIKAFNGLDGIGYSEHIEFIQAQFLKAYDPIAKNENQQAALPESVRRFIEGAADNVRQLPGKARLI